jgi:hypothetical protein
MSGTGSDCPCMFFSCLLLFGRSKRSKVAVKSERPTMKVKPSASSEGLRITNMVTPSKFVRGAHPTKPMCHHLAVKGERPTMKVTPSAHKRKPTKTNAASPRRQRRNTNNEIYTKRSQAKAYKEPIRRRIPRSKRSKVAVKSERPTKKVKPSALSEGLRITNMVTPSKLVRGAHPTKNQCAITSPSRAKLPLRIKTRRSQAKAYE